MPHLMGYCDCGREIHFPRHAGAGYQWRCYRCGKVWVLSDYGEPRLFYTASFPPAGERASDQRGCGCLLAILIALILFKCG